MLTLGRKYTILSVVYICMCDIHVRSMCMYADYVCVVVSKWVASKERMLSVFFNGFLPHWLAITFLTELEIHHFSWVGQWALQYLALSPIAEVTAWEDIPSFLHGCWRFELTFSRLQNKCSESVNHLSSPKLIHFLWFTHSLVFFNKKNVKNTIHIKFNSLEWDRFWRISAHAYKGQ